MQLHIIGHHLQVTEALKEHITHQFNKIERHFHDVMEVRVTLAVEKIQHRVQVTAHIPPKDEIHVEVENGDMYTAVDLVVEKLNRQITRHKEKLKDYHKK